MKILVGFTGSVATGLCQRLCSKLESQGHELKLVFTKRATQFIDKTKDSDFLDDSCFYEDADEFYQPGEYSKGGLITHIDLRDWADIFLIAPCSANTLAKIANGLCDNLLTSIVRAWDWDKPFYVAPAMNTNMWTHPVTKLQLDIVKKFGANIIWPTSNILACGQSGIGAMAHIDTIVNLVAGHRWEFPLIINYKKVPVFPHPGAFGVTRKHYNHTGIDLYVDSMDGACARAVEAGKVIAIEPFTGEIAGTPWWNNTYHVTVSGKSGKVVYGEIEPLTSIKIGKYVEPGDYIGYIRRVIIDLPEKPPRGHKPSMLHLELLSNDFDGVTAGDWHLSNQKNKNLLDPTPYLMLTNSSYEEI